MRRLTSSSSKDESEEEGEAGRCSKSCPQALCIDSVKQWRNDGNGKLSGGQTLGSSRSR